MSGGIFGARGYLYQATVCLLDSLFNENWDYVNIEPDSQNEKIDISWELDGKVSKVVQVKSSINTFKKGQVNKWIHEMIEDSIESQMYELVLIGEYTSKTQKFIDAINTSQESMFRDRLKEYKGKLLVRGIEYKYDSFVDSINSLLHKFFRGKSYDIGSNAIKLISRASIFDYMKFSTQGTKLSKQEFEKLLIKSANAVKLNSSDEVISIEFNKSKEEIRKRQFNIKDYIFKSVIFLMLLVFILVGIRVFCNNIFNLILPKIYEFGILSIVSILICCIFIISIIVLLNISNYKFMQLYDEYYPILSIRQLETYYNNYLKAIVTETRFRKDRLIYVDHEVEIFNNSDEIFNTIDSTIEGVCKKDNKEQIVLDESLYLTDLKSNDSNIAYKKTILRQWNSEEEDQYKFNVKINLGDNHRNEEITLSTPRLIKTFFLELNYFKYIKVFKMIIPFEISWLKDKLYLIRDWYKYKRYGSTRIIAIICCPIISILTLIGFIKVYSLLLLMWIIYLTTERAFRFLRKYFGNY